MVTGGASGIGLGIVQALAKRGMKIVIADLDEPAIDSAVAATSSLGTQVIGHVCDVTNLDDVRGLAARTMDEFGQVNVVCNNAGVGLPTPVADMDLAYWRWILDVNLWGPIHGMNIFLPLLESANEGHISATSSLAGLVAPENMGAYAASKHAVVGFMTAVERELRSKSSSVRTSLLCPAFVNTNISFNSVSRRPGASASRPKRTEGENRGRSIQSSLSQGIQPIEVGELLADAIRDEKFWVLTHEEWLADIDKQSAAMRGDQSLTALSL